MSSKRLVKILMVDDHPSMLEGYKIILAYNEINCEIETVSAHNCQHAYEIIIDPDNRNVFDIAFLDYNLPVFEEKNINNGEDLAVLLKEYSPRTKIAILTSHTEGLLLYGIVKNVEPLGMLVKSDFTPEQLLVAFEMILKSETYYSLTVKQVLKDILHKEKYLDKLSRQILTLLGEGVKNKSMPEMLGISLSTIEKRKAQIRLYLNIISVSDEDLVKEAKKQGLI